MNNFEKIKAMTIEEMAKTMGNYAAFCVFKLIEKQGCLGMIDDIAQQRYKKDLINITKGMLQAESEEQ